MNGNDDIPLFCPPTITSQVYFSNEKRTGVLAGNFEKRAWLEFFFTPRHQI